MTKYFLAALLSVLLAACGVGGAEFDGMVGSYVSTSGRIRVTFSEGKKILEVKYRDAEKGKPKGDWFFGFPQIVYEMKDGVVHFQYPGGSAYSFKMNANGTLTGLNGEIYEKQ